jgi:predicted metal-dependent hydrolase
MLYPGKKTHALRTVDGWVVFVGPQTKRRSLHTFCWSLLAEAESPRIEDLVDRINEEEFGVRIRDIRLKFASSQWGSCSPRGIVMLNAALLLAPPSVLRYVISHELAHFEHPNHSKDFWREVRRVMPTYKRAMNTIHNYRLPTL